MVPKHMTHAFPTKGIGNSKGGGGGGWGGRGGVGGAGGVEGWGEQKPRRVR